MPDRIKLLDPETVKLIAAGEVVVRPAAVIKELVENAVDAGATSITVELEGDGRDFLQVTDNGWGISAADLLATVEKHATSKIMSVADLETITTMGFRGEALASIAAVSRLEIVSREPGSLAGHKLTASGKEVSLESTGCPPGTRVRVLDLFCHVPARRAFLKSRATETARVSEYLTGLALVFPEIAFHLRQQGRTVFRTPGTGDWQQTLVSLLGIETMKAMFPLRYAGGVVGIEGWLGEPAISRSDRKEQFYYVNKRLIYNRGLAQAGERGYATLLPAGRFPVLVINLKISPREVDVNIHPAKLEVRFHDERAALAEVEAAVGQALKGRVLIPGWRPDMPVAVDVSPLPRIAETDSDYVTATAGTGLTAAGPAAMASGFPELVVMGQAYYSYIIAHGQEGLFLIDQHAAHERIRYERIYPQLQGTAGKSQSLVVPLPVELSPGQEAVFVARTLPLRDLGFILEHLEGRHYFLRGVPYGIDGLDAGELFFDLISRLEDKEIITGSIWAEMAALTACKGAVKAGQSLAATEMQALLTELAACEIPYTCPHGRPTIIHLGERELARRFLRA